MKIEDIERIIAEYLKFRTDSNGYAVINVEDFLKYFRFSYEQLNSNDNHDHYFEWVIDKSGYRRKCKKCGEIFFEVITNED
ncbi:hypothetical protein ACG3JJ_01150 [Streptococcus parauberis]|uniref:hypothetical protein n=1 Tax=Streptococcus parauberis TaxID=1348 RepID=UPI0002DFA5D6|nr:hypothetical protein [Streptococcus parauberis]QBX27434.1 hypothetical protein Javan386_0035 [Streptococcus phage Javan386]UWM90929.1 hypothetical protein N2A94_10645 [Streptococcus parauberis]